MKTYKDVINVIENSTASLYVAIYPFAYQEFSCTWVWVPLDKEMFVRELKEIANLNDPFYCLFQVDLINERDGPMLIHPKIENK